MPFLRRADEVVVGEAKRLVHGAEASRVAVGQGAWGKAFLGGRLLHLESVLVGAGEEEHVLAVEALEASDGVGGDGLVGVADVGRPVGVGDGGGDVELLLPAHGRRSPFK